MKCRDHGREPCTVPRCQVLALCAAEALARPWRWLLVMGYEHPGNVTFLAQQIADRLVAWMRWRGERRVGVCARARFTATHMLSVRPGIDDHWGDQGPGFYHPLDELLPYNERIRALSGTCPAAKCTGYHDNPTWKPGRWEPPLVPCDHEGIDWATVLVFLDWLADRGWTLQEVHEWRPTADPLPTAPQNARRRI